ncbi:MAG: phosphomannomutase/phosphoglucomutase [Methylophaga sp.]|nr:phosphomannomutase/phosphoglucomutase [Methylophaga sp.]
MGELSKLVLSLGHKLISVVTFIASCAAVAAGFFWLQQFSLQQSENEKTRYQEQVMTSLYKVALSRIDNLNAQMSSVATSPKIISLLTNGEAFYIEEQQQELASFFPNALKTCLISADVDDVNGSACLPITFATLKSIRQAKEEGRSLIGLMKKGTDDEHVLLAHRIQNESGDIVGVLVVTLEPNIINDLLDNDPQFQGYTELLQGSQKAIALTSSGASANKEGSANLIRSLPGTYWKIAYWPQKNISSTSPLMNVLGVVLAALLLMWLLRDGLKAYLLKRDVRTLRSQLTDFKSATLKPTYPLFYEVLSDIVNDVQRLGIENYQSTVKKGATAESISKKIEENGIDNPAESGLLKETNKIEINIDKSLFKANDIRGIVGQDFNEETVKIIGHAIGSEAGEQGQNRLIVGRDGRLSSESLSNALIEGILASGCDVINIGEVPTPVMYFACKHMDTQSGIMITGSHNPPEYNGLKVILDDKILYEDSLLRIYQRAQQDDFRTGEGSLSEENVMNEYIGRIAGDITVSRPMKVVIDCGNGVAGAVAPELFKALGCDVIELHCDVDGNFPNHHPNPSDPENLQDLIEAVKQHGAELGLAFDGDGDRLGVVDASGTPIWPDRLMMLFARDVLLRQPGSVVVYDVKCSNLLGEEISSSDGEAVMTKSGYAFIKNKMQELDAQLAGELSGHIFFKERWYGFDDGLYAGSRLLELLANDALRRKATDIFAALPNQESTAEIFVDLAAGDCQQFIQKLVSEGQFDGAELITIDGVRAEYPNGWGLVRVSNTMPGLTLRFEANSVEELHDIQQKFKQQMLQIKPTLKLLF